MKICPECNRTYSDETFRFCLEDGSLLSAPFEEEVVTVLRLKSSESKVPREDITAQIDAPVIAINIAQQYPNVRTDDDLYQCTRGLWRLRKDRAEKARYAFAVFKGIIREVYAIDHWEPANIEAREFWEDTRRSRGAEINPAVNDGRFQFVGRLAETQVREKYVGAAMPLPHGQNPIRYFNC